MGKSEYSHDDQRKLASNIARIPKDKHEKVFNMLTKGTKEGEKCFQLTNGGMHINLKAIEPSTLKKVEKYVEKILGEDEEDEIDEMVDNEVAVKRTYRLSAQEKRYLKKV